MSRWGRLIALWLLGAAIALYAGDWLVFNLRRGPTEKVMVSYFISAPLKNNKEDREFLGSDEEACSASILPQGGHAPCWYLRRHKDQVKSI